MSKFPEALHPPDSVTEERNSRYRIVSTAAKLGITVRSAIILGELVGYFFYESHALLADALASLLDVCSTFLLLICMKKAHQPPDHNHPLGHGRFEPVAGLQIGFLLIGLGLFLLANQLIAIFQGGVAERLDSHTWLIPFAGVILLELCYQRARRAAKKSQSAALMADAIHYRIDSLSTLFATAALLAASFLSSYSSFIDTLGAGFIALFMIVMGVIASKKNLKQLLDHLPEKSYFERVRKAAMSVKEVLATEKLRLQVYGPDAHVAIDIELEPELSVEEAHKITQKVRLAIQEAWPAVRDVIVHVEPFYPNDH